MQLALLEDNADLQQHFVSVHGLQAVLEILEMTATESVTVPLLDILCIVSGHLLAGATA